MLTVKQAAERLCISAALVYQLCAQEKLPHVRLGCGRGTIRIPEQDLEQFLAALRVGDSQPIAAPIPLKHLKAPLIRSSR